MENEPESLDKLRLQYLDGRKPFVAAFQVMLYELTKCTFDGRDKLKEIVDDVNRTRRLLAVAFKFDDSDNRLSLSVASSSFQLKTADRNQRQVYCGRQFPLIKVFDPHSEEGK